MHILMISVRSDLGGGPKHMYDLCSGLLEVETKIKLSIASPLDKPFGELFSKISNVHIPIPHRKFSLIGFLKLLYFCKTENVDLIHSHGRGAGVYSRLLNLFGIRVVHTFHGAHLETSFVNKLKFIFDKCFKNCVDQYICVSTDEKKKVLNLGWADLQQVQVIHNGVDVEKIYSQFHNISKAEARDKFQLPQDKVIWGTLARLTYQKGIDLLFETLRKNKDSLSQIVFAIAGDGENREKLELLIAEYSLENVILVGATENPIEFLRALDGYFSYARWEGLPISVIEALAVQLPCLISNVEGHHDFRSQCTYFDLNHDLDFVHQIERGVHSSSEIFEFNLSTMVEKTLNVY